jgi:4-aminobutyrate aminotransferase / (S)-3-amino-2-methylpropionate transaminase / 5-aminovalerate transaminase
LDGEFSRIPQWVPKLSTRYRRIVTKLPVPESLPILGRIEKYEPRSLLGQPPVVWDRAEGFQVYDRYGNMWLDWSSGVLVANIGHANDAVKQAIIREVEKSLLFSYCFPSESRSLLAERLARLAPRGLDKVFFLTTGSEAAENAIKLARTYGQKFGGNKKIVIVTFELGFHGRTLGAQLAGGYPEAKSWIGHLDPAFVQVPFPDGFRCKNIDFDLFEASLAEQGIEPDEVAAVMMESYQGGGASFAPPAYVQALRAWCDAHRALLVFDEVQAGFGRSGKLFAFEHYGVDPDLICLGKGISGSLPLSAVLGRGEIMDLYGPGSMTSTHGGHSISCAAALANLEVLLEEECIDRAAAAGEFLYSGLREIAQRYSPHIGALHGKGMVYGLHIVEAGSEHPDGALAFQIVRRCFESGLLMFAPVGLGGATVKICPPLIMTIEALAEGLQVLESAFAEVCAPQRRVAEGGA